LRSGLFIIFTNYIYFGRNLSTFSITKSQPNSDFHSSRVNKCLGKKRFSPLVKIKSKKRKSRLLIFSWLGRLKRG